MNFYYLGPKGDFFKHNLKIVPGLKRIDSLDEIEGGKKDFFFYMKEDELVFDQFFPTKIVRADESIRAIEKACLTASKDVAFIPLRTVNYYCYPPKTLSYTMEPRVFRFGAFNPDVKLDKTNKKHLYNMVLLNLYKQVNVNIEIGIDYKGSTPKMLGLNYGNMDLQKSR